MTDDSNGRSDTERSFLQQRVALLSLVLSALGVLGLAGSLFGSDLRPQLPWFISSGVSTSAWVALWLFCRGTPRSAGLCRTVEAVCLLCTGVAMAVMCRVVGPSGIIPGLDPLAWGTESGGHYWGLSRLYWALAHVYGLSLYCMLRAALVPSRPRRTLILTFLVGMPLMVFVSTPSLPLDPPELGGSVVPSAYSLVGGVNLSTQWAFTVAICTLLSKTIFGLRRELQQARRLGQYTLEAKIGEGGMGTVYRASHAMMRRPTAVKLLSPNSTGRDRHERFEREVQQTARLTHPNTITVFDYGRTPEGHFYYAMELLAGATAETVVDLTGPMLPSRVIHVLSGVCGSLEEAHGVGLIHRDVKPANIFLCVQGGRPDVPKLLDFGLVKKLARGTAEAELTDAASLTGTPLYMAPEMISRPDSVDARTDIYAVGAVGYFLLTGTHVFEGATVVEVCSHHLHSEPQRPSERLGSPLPEALESLILSCLRKHPGERPQTVATLADRLMKLDRIEPWTVPEARQWWADKGKSLATQTEPASALAGSTTIAVDLSAKKV